MANVSKMSTTNAPGAAPAHVFAFFEFLPPELRLNIYKKAFHGARVHAVLAMEDEPSGGGKRHLVRFRHSSKHFDLLRTCRKIHDEALPTYWSEATLNLVQLHIIAGSPTKSCQWMKDVDYTADDYSYHLCRSLPDVVKANVKHIRGMMLPPVDGNFVKKNPQLTPTAMLSNFKRLATCGVSPTILCHPEVKRVATNISPTPPILLDSEINTEGNTESIAENIAENDLTNPFTRDRVGRFKTFWKGQSSEPKDLMRKICGIDATAEVVFLVKAEVVVVTWTFDVGAAVPGIAALAAINPRDADRLRGETNEMSPPRRFHTVHQFWNLSAGIYYEADADRVADEEGYDIVIRGGPEFEAADGQTG